MTDAAVIAAIRHRHLAANIAQFEHDPDRRTKIFWGRAWVDAGGTVFGEGPYLKVPVRCPRIYGDNGLYPWRVYAPARLRRRLARLWTRHETRYAEGR